MPRGGARPNAGRRGGWSKSGTETKTIRVPKDLADMLVEIAKRLDRGESPESIANYIDSVTKPKQDPQLTLASVLVPSTLCPLSMSALARRFGVVSETVRRRVLGLRGKKQSFEEWSAKKDPENVSWSYRAEDKKCIPNK